MLNKPDKNTLRAKRHARVRKKVSGTPQRPRLCVYRSLNHIYAQIIDDVRGTTLFSASTMDKQMAAQIKDMTKVQAARQVGKVAAERAVKGGVNKVVFDRGGYLYTGRVAELAAGAREAGLEF